MSPTALSLALILLLAPAAAAQTAPPAAAVRPSLTIPRVSAPPSLTDYLDGVPRPDEAAITTFVQREPGDGVPASQQTEAYVSYDATHLYVIFVAREDAPGQVRASLTRREGFGNDDAVGVILDTFNDRRRAYLFIVNPLGVQLDGVTTDGSNDDYSYDTVWDSEGQLTSFGFVARIAIPFKSLRFANVPEQEWGIGFARIIRRNNETSFWPYVTKRVSNVMQQLAVARGMREISAGRNIHFIPYAAFTRARFLDKERPAFATDTDTRAGVDGKIVVKDAFTVDLTLNPDFSQVESDEPQVTINRRFEVFFPEKRPFFIENASYFQTPITLFFSRRIADPQLGLRVTGKAGGWSVAGLAIDDRAPGRRVEPGDPARGDRTGIGVVRLQRDFGRQSSIGVLATTRDFGPLSSRVASVDGRYRLSDTWTASAQAAASRSTVTGGETLHGPAVSVFLDHNGRAWGGALSYRDVSPGFRAPLGFVPRVDIRTVRSHVRYMWFADKGPLVGIRPVFSGGMLWNHAGTLNDWDAGGEINVELKGQSEIEAGYGESMERFAGVEFRKHGMSLQVQTSWLKWLEASGEIKRGRDINFFPSAGVPPFLADGSEAELSLRVKPVPAMRLDQAYIFTRLSTRPGLARVPAGQVIVDNHIWRSRASYQFTRRWSLRAILDYSAVLPDLSLIDLEREKRFTADALVTYLVNPWTALYAGYTDGYGNVEIDPISRDRLRPTDSAFHPTGRQVFIKLSYLLRF